MIALKMNRMKVKCTSCNEEHPKLVTMNLLVSAGASCVGNAGHRAENEEHVLDAGVNVDTVSMSRHQENRDH